MRARLQKLHVDITEIGNRSFPIVKHVFVGRTRSEAKGYHRAHRKTDSFMRGCERKGKFKGISCEVRIYWR